MHMIAYVSTSSSCDQQSYSCQSCVAMTGVWNCKVLDSWSLIWKYSIFGLVPPNGSLQSQQKEQSNQTSLSGFYCIYLWNPMSLWKDWKEGSSFSKQKLGWNMLKPITKQHLSPNAPLQEVIKRIFIRHLHGCRSSLWAKDPSWSSPKFYNPRLRILSHPLTTWLTWKIKEFQCLYMFNISSYYGIAFQ